MKFLFMAPPAFASGPAQYSSLWNLFISTILKIMKERLKIQASGPAGFIPWDRLNIPVCETSSQINPRFVTALEKVFLTFYMICKAGQNQKKNSGHQTNDVVFWSALRFAVPQFSPGTGLLNQKRNPHEITSVIPSITILLSGLHGFLKAVYQSKRSLILIRDTSKFLPNSSSVFWFRSFRSEPAY